MERGAVFSCNFPISRRDIGCKGGAGTPLPEVLEPERRKKMKKTKGIVLAIMVVVLLPGLGLAMTPASERGMGLNYPPYPGGRSAGPALWAALNLSPEQGQKMRDLRESLFKESIPLRNEIRSKRFELKALWAQTSPDEGKILAKQKEISVLRSDLQEKVTKSRLEMRKILTPEQQAKWSYLRAQFRRSRGFDGGYQFGPAHGYFGGGRAMGYSGWGPRW